MVFPAPFGPEQADRAAGSDREIDAGERPMAVVLLDEPLDLDQHADTPAFIPGAP